MNIQIISNSRSKSTAVEVVLFLKSTLLHPLSFPLNDKESQSLQAILDQTQDGPYEDSDLVDLDDRVLVLLDVGKAPHLSAQENLRLAAYRLSQIVQKRRFNLVRINLEQVTAQEFTAFVAGLHFGHYQFDRYKSDPKPIHQANFELIAGDQAQAWQQLAQDTSLVLQQVSLARDLVNEPGGSLNPQEFTRIAAQLGKQHGLKVKIRTASQLEQEGFGGLIAVGKGSLNPPTMVTLTYNPRKSHPDVHLGIVGKGLTFDTGGISLKPSQDMWEMKMDMAGAATTLGAVLAISALQIPLKVTAVLCIAENRPGAEAQLPGDIFTAKNGKTVMVDNTDAEGRLALSDGLCEAADCGVTHLIDLATLTGAMVRALGTSVTGIFANSAPFGELILEAGKLCGEKFWPMPLEMEYQESLKDTVADLKNVGGTAGAITAALFLQEFVAKGIVWSHWDIAGTAFTTKAWKYVKHGGTGFGVQSLVEVARKLAGLESLEAYQSDSPQEDRISAPAPQQPSAPKKRGRGRPRKDPVALSTTETAAPKRGRGRPRKTETTPSATPVASPKRGRGRPRKNPLPAEVTPPKRRRGRPRKNS